MLSGLSDYKHCLDSSRNFMKHDIYFKSDVTNVNCRRDRRTSCELVSIFKFDWFAVEFANVESIPITSLLQTRLPPHPFPSPPMISCSLKSCKKSPGERDTVSALRGAAIGNKKSGMNVAGKMLRRCYLSHAQTLTLNGLMPCQGSAPIRNRALCD